MSVLIQWSVLIQPKTSEILPTQMSTTIQTRVQVVAYVNSQPNLRKLVQGDSAARKSTFHGAGESSEVASPGAGEGTTTSKDGNVSGGFSPHTMTAVARPGTAPVDDGAEGGLANERRPPGAFAVAGKHATNPYAATAHSKYRDVDLGSYRLQEVHLTDKMLKRAKKSMMSDDRLLAIPDGMVGRARTAPGRQRR